MDKVYMIYEPDPDIPSELEPMTEHGVFSTRELALAQLSKLRDDWPEDHKDCRIKALEFHSEANNNSGK